MEHMLTIHKLIHGGKGLGTLADGMVVMVPGVLPGETVRVREVKAHRGHKEAELIRIEEPSPDRVTPPCPYYGRCGGCNLQHAGYAAQLRSKREILRESLVRARLELAEDQPLPTLPSPESFAYRFRIRLHLDDKDRPGYHRSQTNQVVAIEHCMLATDPINRVLKNLAAQDLSGLFKGRIQAIELIQSPTDGRVVLVLHPHKNRGKQNLSDLSSLSGLADELVLASSKPGRGKQATATLLAQDFLIRDHAYRLQWTPACFFQVNALQNPRLISLATEAATILEPPYGLLDLFCGMGNFSLPLALDGAQVFGIEHNRESIHWAARNCRDNAVGTARFMAADVERELQRLISKRQEVDCILLDPPRQGLGKAAALLPLLQPRLIISISCDPATHARDLQTLTVGGYRLCRITPVDMFPQTHHIESLAVLERN